MQEAYKQIIYQLYSIYDDREAAHIADMLIEHITEFRRMDRLLNKNMILSQSQENSILQMMNELIQHKPVQYVLNEAWFIDMKFYVNEHVLIPRPETEELVEWILERQKVKNKKVKILDIATGSGCIAIALQRKLAGAITEAMDISGAALRVAKKNAVHIKADVDFKEADILNESSWKTFGQYDIIVSNPPYIKKSEAAEMRLNVLQYEPAIALFVPDDDALVFYKAIGHFAKQHLVCGGNLFMEINEAHAEELIQLFTEMNFENIIVKKDMQGKDRMICAEKLEY